MANIDAPFGLRPIAKSGQNPNNGGQTQYDVGASQSTAIFTGDPVKYKNDGTVEVATASDALLGVFMGGFYTCLLYTSPSPRDRTRSRMPSSA